MATKVFDTYMPGAEDDLVSFFNSISDGRVLCLAVLVSGCMLVTQGPSRYHQISICLRYLCMWETMAEIMANLPALAGI